jgi:hypothetical protein
MPVVREGQDAPQTRAAKIFRGVPAPFEQRHDLNHLLSTHPGDSDRKHVQSESSDVRARTAAYDMTSRQTHARMTIWLSFKLPAILGALRTKMNNAAVRHSKRSATSLYKPRSHGSEQIGTSAHHLAAPLLPSLLFCGLFTDRPPAASFSNRSMVH